MATTTNKGYDLPARGDDPGTWDVPVNDNMGIIDKNFGGVLSLALSSSNVALTTSQAQNAIIRLSGTLTANVTVTFPSVGSFYIIDNQTTGAFYVLLSCGAGQKIATQQGASVDVYTDGTNVKFRNLGKIAEYWDYASSSVPNWVTACTVPPYLICDGSVFSAVTYPYLAEYLGSTTLPDLRGRARFFLNAGTGRITAAGSGIDGDNIRASGGDQQIALSIGEMPVHDHAGGNHDHALTTLLVSASGASNPVAISYLTANTGLTFSGRTDFSGTVVQPQGSGEFHNNMPPACISGITMIRAA